MSEPGFLTEPPQVIDPKRLFQLRISLRGVRPSVWRSVVVSPETTFDTLHDVIQAAMGWENFHLHRFGWTMRMGGSYISDSYWDSYADDEGRTYALGSTPVGAIHFRVGDSFIYEYDMGDQWVHDVRVEKKPERKGGRRHPWVLDGKGACPPEDSGGPYIYPVLVKLARGKGAVKGELREYGIGRMRAREILGRGFDPTEFDRQEANDTLAFWELR